MPMFPNRDVVEVAEFVQRLQLAVLDLMEVSTNNSKTFLSFDSFVLCFSRSGHSPVGFVPMYS